MKLYQIIKTIDIKEEKEKARRERLRQLNVIRKDEKDRIFEMLESKTQEKVKYVQVDDKNVVPVIMLQDLKEIFEETKNYKRKRKFN